jgi:hypothetical protein
MYEAMMRTIGNGGDCGEERHIYAAIGTKIQRNKIPPAT